MIYMPELKDFFMPHVRHQLLLLVVLVIYIVMNVQTPDILVPLIDNLIGNIVVVLLALSVFMDSSAVPGPMRSVVGVVALIAAYELIKRSSVNEAPQLLKHLPSSENKKVIDFDKYNEFPVTLEEEVVAKMAPLVKHQPAPNSNYKPAQDKIHDAADINYQGVI